MYRWLKDEFRTPPVTFFSTLDGTATSNLAQMDDLPADAIACQESLAHLAAFCFLPARSALEWAAVPQVLLELCRVRRSAMAGMSIDYVKCFDVIPQVVALAVALEVGIDLGRCHAPGAMYKQLRRAFKIAGAFGCWWRAINGILQGCPLSAI